VKKSILHPKKVFSINRVSFNTIGSNIGEIERIEMERMRERECVCVCERERESKRVRERERERRNDHFKRRHDIQLNDTQHNDT
jgi:hypothetical protein